MATCRVDINAVEQQVKLLGREFGHGLLTTGTNEVANFEPLHEPKTGPIIEQQLHAIPFPIVEPEVGSRERIELHQLLDHRHQRVQHGAEVDRLAMQVLVATPWRQRAGGRHQARTANL